MPPMTLPNPQAAGGAQAASGAASYEFSAGEGRVIRKTAAYARGWGILSMVIASVQITMGIVALREMAPGVVQLPAGIVQVVVGIAFIQAASSLREVVRTEGNDIAHMMSAVRALGVAFLVQIIAVAAGFLLSIALASVVSRG
jgi:hypothetical protein